MLPSYEQFKLVAVANRHRTNWTQENALLEEVILDLKSFYPEKFHNNSTLDERKFAGVPSWVKYGRRGANRD
jgi:hypothetical protein